MPLTLHAIPPGSSVLVGDLQFQRAANRRPRLAIRVWVPTLHIHQVVHLPDDHAIEAVAEVEIHDPSIEGDAPRAYVTVDPARIRECGKTLDHFRGRLRSYLAELRHAGRLADRPVVGG